MIHLTPLQWCALHARCREAKVVINDDTNLLNSFSPNDTYVRIWELPIIGLFVRETITRDKTIIALGTGPDFAGKYPQLKYPQFGGPLNDGKEDDGKNNEEAIQEKAEETYNQRTP